MVHEDSVARVLRPWLGAAFLAACDICAQLCGALNAFSPEDGDPAALSAQLDTLLFHRVRELTRGDMRVLLDDGRVIRIRVDDIDQMADELLYLALCRLPLNAWQYGRLRQFALSHESLSALRALYERFAAFQTEDELALIARTVRGCHPAYRWRGWLPDQREP
ncbi:MAG: hypothetical protein IJ214_09165 [Clostridia bacterium]|nr:hypothetical protein [Clostridia bacterium]